MNNLLLHSRTTLVAGLTFGLVYLPFLAAPQSVAVLERGPHHDSVEAVTTHVDEFGQTVLRTNRYTAIASGLNVFSQGAWHPARAEFALLPDALVADQLQFYLRLGANANSRDAVQLVLPDGQSRLRSQLIAVQYWDAASGQSAPLGFIQDAQAELVAENQVVYRRVLDGVGANLIYGIGLDHAEQNLAIVERPPEPELLNPNMRSASTRLEIWTEFFEFPPPRIYRRVVRQESDPARQMVEPNLTHDDVDFGSMLIPSGRAFVVNGQAAVPTYVRWLEIEQRWFLVEYSEYSRLKPLLDTLPPMGAGLQRLERAQRVAVLDPARQRAAGRAIPAAPNGQARLPKKPRQVADLRRSKAELERGVLFDYTILLTQTNALLRGDNTWLVMSTVNLSSTNNVLEGGAVLKFTNSTSAKINVLGSLKCQATSFRPAICTSFSDDTVGDKINGSTGNPTNYHGNGLVFNTTGATLNNVRFSYADSAVSLQYEAGQLGLTNVQFVKCRYPINSSTYDQNNIWVDNGLFYVSFYVVKGGRDLLVRGSHWTVNQCDKLGSLSSGDSELYLTNCVLVRLTNGFGNFSVTNTNYTAKLDSDAGVFQVLGGASHYLASSGVGAGFRDAGTTNINPSLLAGLRRMTTEPPLLLTNNVTVDTILAPQFEGDVSKPDLGYHYDLLHWVASGTIITNGTLLLTNAVAVATYGSSGSYGLRIAPSGKLVSASSPTNRNWILRYNTVQEQATTNWSSSTVAPAVKVPSGNNPAPEARFRFTGWSLLGGNGDHLNCDNNSSINSPFEFKDCEFYGGGFFANRLALGLTNCLWQRVKLALQQPSGSAARYAYNNLFYGGSVEVEVGNGSASFYDNLFDGTTLTQNGTVSHGWNGYVTNANRLQPTQPTTDQVLSSTNLDYQLGPLGRFYYPTSGTLLKVLIDTGSRNATNAGLYHYTVATNKEAATAVDIGHHWIALTSGVPKDSDADGLPDYFENRSGTGATNTVGETSWLDTDSDDDGLGDLQEFELSNNVLVNDPAHDFADEQNTQFESTCAVLNGKIIVAYVDSNSGVYGLGSDHRLTNYTPRLVGYAVSRDGGVTFQDMGVPPLSRAGPPTDDDGEAADPVLAVDHAAGVVYLVGTSPRNAGYKGIPLWKSTDGGVTFANPIIVREDILESDKPWLAVDNASGTGQHDVYLGCRGKSGVSTNDGLWVSVSTDGYGTNWTTPVAIRELGVANVTIAQSLIMLVGPDHTAYTFWIERTGGGLGTNWLKMRQVLNRGATLGSVHTVGQLVATNQILGNLELKRSNSADPLDTFRAYPFPVPSVNPVKTNHVYVAYADKGTNANDRADVFFVRSSDGGGTWTNPVRVNTDTTTNDQWLPVLAVKPDGTQLLMAWYDRRNNTTNSLIEVYGRWGTIASSGGVTFGTEFRITTTNFPPVFAGTLPDNTTNGHYDPVFPPEGVNLHWHYPEWPEDPAETTQGTYIGLVGEYNGAWAEGPYVYVTWMDYRLPSVGTLYGRNQSDIRFVRITWP